MTIHHNIAASRFETIVEGHQSVAEYRLAGNDMIFTHTYVPPELRGRSIASQLIRVGVDFARKENKNIVPQCSYVAAWLQRHPAD